MLSDDILKSMPQDKLIELIHIYSKNWLAMDGAWCSLARKIQKNCTQNTKKSENNLQSVKFYKYENIKNRSSKTI